MKLIIKMGNAVTMVDEMKKDTSLGECSSEKIEGRCNQKFEYDL